MIGIKIKKLRTSNKMSQDEFAKKIFSTKSTISKWENSKANPSLHDLDQIANIFNIDISYFIKGRILNNKIKSKSKIVVSNIKKANYSGLLEINLNNKWKNSFLLLFWSLSMVIGFLLWIPLFVEKENYGDKAVIFLLVGIFLIILGMIFAAVHLLLSIRWSILKRENAIVKISNQDFEIISRKSNRGILVPYENIEITKTSRLKNVLSIELSINNNRKLTLLKVDESVLNYIQNQKGGK